MGATGATPVNHTAMTPGWGRDGEEDSGDKFHQLITVCEVETLSKQDTSQDVRVSSPRT